MDMQFNIVSLAFKERNKWRLTDGHRDISATIEDKDFLSRIDNYEESFTKGDTLSCRVRIEQSTVLNKLKTTYTVEKVLDHKTGTRQAMLDFDNNYKEEATRRLQLPFSPVRPAPSSRLPSRRTCRLWLRRIPGRNFFFRPCGYLI